jgi:hypothetical protein
MHFQLKAITLSLVILYSFQPLYSQWSSEIQLNAGINEGYLWPRIDLTDDQAFVIWGNKANETIYASLINDGLASPAFTLNANLNNAFITDWASTEMDADGDNIAVVYKASNAEKGSSYLIYSNNGGDSFTDPVEVVNGDSILHRFPEVYINGKDIYISFMHFEPGWADPQYVMIHSSDGGVSFSDLIDVTANYGGESCDCCVSNIIGNETELILLFRNNDMNFRDIYAAHTNRSQLNFNQFHDLNLATWELFSCPATGADGHINGNSLYTVFMSGHSGRNQIYLSSLDLNSGNLDYDVPLLDSLGERSSYNYPRMAGNQDTVGIVWQEQTTRDISLYFSYSTTGIEGIGENISLISESNNGRQLNPDIAFKDGVFHFTWQDNSQSLVKYRSFDTKISTRVEEKLLTGISLSPSPVNDVLQISLDDAWSSGKIIDMRGASMLQFRNQSSIDVSKLSKGMYILELTLFEGSKTTTPFIKQ